MINREQSRTSLFRSEAVLAKADGYLGSVLIHQPFGYSLAATLSMLFTVAVFAAGYFGTYTPKSKALGLLTPEYGMLRLTAASSGELIEINVREGQHVQAGDTLFVISAERISGAGATQERIAEQLTKRALLLEKGRSLARDKWLTQTDMLDKRLASLTQELDRFEDELRLLARRVELAHLHSRRQRELVQLGFISIAQLQQAEAEFLTIEGQRQAVRRARAALDRECTELRAQRADAELHHRADISELDTSAAMIKQEQAENEVRARHVHAAPFAGTVTGLNVQLGQQVPTGALMASLIAQDATLTAHIYLAPRRAGFIQPGHTVMMRYVAYPYQKFGMAKGQVLEIAKSPYAIAELPPHIASAVQDTGRPADLFYRATVKLNSQHISVYGNPQSLQAGMLLEADVMQDTRRLYEWALEPIYSLAGKENR